MSPRSKVPMQVSRCLWSETLGHCMNPACETDLFPNNTHIGEQAHIVPVAEDGENCFDNLIILCPNCHTIVDGSRNLCTVNTLRGWKQNRNKEIRQRFTRQYQNFDDLKTAVVPLLLRNSQIYEDYGPESENLDDGEERYAFWQKFEGDIVSNNDKLVLLLESNAELIHKDYRSTVRDFVSHSSEFKVTRDALHPLKRIKIFPKKLLSIFGIKQYTDNGLVPNVSALQNFIRHLKDEDSFIELQLLPNQILRYRECGEDKDLSLRDGPCVDQTFWNHYCFQPKTTNLRLEKLIFFLQWLKNNNISFEFGNPRDLTDLRLQGVYRIKLFYEYCLSVADLNSFEISSDCFVVNLHNWNESQCISPSAYEYARQIGFSLFNQNEFFVYAHRRVKNSSELHTGNTDNQERFIVS